MEFLILCLEFFKTGLFSIGGGLATLPFLYEMAENHNWFTHADLADMIAVAESTPGPMGVNISTYAGFNSIASTVGVPFGILGGMCSTLSLVLPSYIVIVIIAKMLQKFRENKYVNGSFEILRPVVAAMIFSASMEIFKLTMLKLNENTNISGINDILSVFNFPAIFLFFIFLFLIMKTKIHPIIFIIAGAVCGVIFQGVI